MNSKKLIQFITQVSTLVPDQLIPKPIRKRLYRTSQNQLHHWLNTYGDLIYDLCISLLTPQKASTTESSEPILAQVAFRSIFREIRSKATFEKFIHYERSWILKIACSRLLKISLQLEGQCPLSPSKDLENRLAQFDSFFHRLPPIQQLLLILKDRYGLPYVEISNALGIPEDSIKVRRQQAMSALEKWIWIEH